MVRVDLLIIDKDMNAIQVNIPRFMLEELNYSQSDIKKHTTKKELNTTINEFIK